uniref:Uncharacterized protein n=1 Tax=Romanomermis culicivorax TaxID=13658 RepID=A0A915J8A8_ROMCU
MLRHNFSKDTSKVVIISHVRDNDIMTKPWWAYSQGVSLQCIKASVELLEFWNNPTILANNHLISTSNVEASYNTNCKKSRRTASCTMENTYGSDQKKKRHETRRTHGQTVTIRQGLSNEYLINESGITACHN